jgi:hypothetical protein
MAGKHLISFFPTERDAQDAFNQVTLAGLSTDEISLIMKDKRQDKKSEMSEPFDEENVVGSVYGVIDAIEGADLDTEPVDLPGLGEVIIAGPLLSLSDDPDLEQEEVEDMDIKFIHLLKDIGINNADLAAFKQRLESGQIIALYPYEKEDRVEMATIFSDNGGDLYRNEVLE